MRSSIAVGSVALMLAVLGGCLAPHHEADHGGAAGHGTHARRRMRVPDPQLELAAQSVRVMARNDLGCRSEVLGLVDVHEDVGTSAQALEELKLRAAELGAQAVVGVDFEHGDGHEATHLSGMAVRCRDLIRGRAYDVVGSIEVPGTMGGEEEAFRKIKERARELRADVLIDVAFEHGEAGRGPTKLRATAIRFREESATQ